MESLTPQQAQAAFADLAHALPRQHTRLQFRKRFGTGELLEPKLLHRATVIAEADRPIQNLLQERPEVVGVVRLLGTAESPVGVAFEAEPTATISSLLSGAEVEQALIVQGRKARLYAYVDPTQEGAAYVLRVAIELPPEPKAPVKRLSRRGKPLRPPKKPRAE